MDLQEKLVIQQLLGAKFEGPKLEARISEGYDSVPKYQPEFLGDPPEEQEI